MLYIIVITIAYMVGVEIVNINFCFIFICRCFVDSLNINIENIINPNDLLRHFKRRGRNNILNIPLNLNNRISIEFDVIENLLGERGQQLKYSIYTLIRSNILININD